MLLFGHAEVPALVTEMVVLEVHRPHGHAVAVEGGGKEDLQLHIGEIYVDPGPGKRIRVLVHYLKFETPALLWRPPWIGQGNGQLHPQPDTQIQVFVREMVVGRGYVDAVEILLDVPEEFVGGHLQVLLLVVPEQLPHLEGTFSVAVNVMGCFPNPYPFPIVHGSLARVSGGV